MKFLKYTSLFVAVMALASCNGGGGVGPTQASGTINALGAQVLATNVAQFAAGLNPQTLQSPANSIPVAGVSASNFVGALDVSPFDSCTTITPATSPDADGDGIAKEKNYTFNCRGITEDFGTTDRLGTIKIKDLDDTTTTAEAGGYSFEYDLNFSSEIEGGSYSGEYKGYYMLEATTQSLRYTSKFLNTFTEARPGDATTGGFESNYFHELIPDDVNDIWAKGTSKTEGFYRLIAKGTYEGQKIDIDVTFYIKSAGLEYEDTNTSGCVSYYKAGSIEFNDTSGNVLRYSYSCQAATYTFNGQVVPNGNQ